MRKADHGPSSTGRASGWGVALNFAWLSGALLLQVPFQLYFRLGNGGFGWNIVISVVLAALGILLVAGLTCLFHALIRDSPRERSLLKWTIALQALASGSLLAAFLPVTKGLSYWGGVAALVAWIAISLTIATRNARRPGARPLRARLRRSRPSRPWRFNAPFWILIFAILLACDLWGLSAITTRNGTDLAILIAGRLLTLATVTMGLLLIVQTFLALSTALTRYLVITVAGIIPLIILADFAAGLYWSQSLIGVLNSFTVAGRLDMTQQLEAGGITQSPTMVLVFLLLAVAAASIGYLALNRFLSFFQIRTPRAALVIGILWIVTVGQQALCMMLLPKEIWQAEHATFKLHLTFLMPDPGFETIPVRFVETQSEEMVNTLLSTEPPTLARKPDIYLVIVETWRRDTITPVITPFLHKFRQEECQQYAQTFAGANCTPVSWFTLFHSRIGMHWKEAVAEKDSAAGFRGAYPIRLLHQLGYKFSVRAVCDLGYQEMSDINFGADHKFADAFLDNPMITPRGLNIPEREILVVDDLERQLLDSTPGGHFHFLSLDSPHYNYYWPEKDFEPLHEDCISTINYASLNPSKEDIRDVVKRYENSIHWIDHQLEEFVTFLKTHDRYDNALIILTGDHGEEFQEDGSWFHCSTLKSPQTDVPLMIKWPEWVEEQPDQAQATHLDVMPSVLDALGLDDKYFINLAGRSLLRPHPGEALISSPWAGRSEVGVCFIKDGLKANFAASGLWSGTVPETLYFVGYADLDDQPIAPHTLYGDRNLPHSQFLREYYPELTTRFFESFGEE